MYSCTTVDPKTVAISVDLNVYNEAVIAKVLYWLSDCYNIFWKKGESSVEIRLEKKEGTFSNEEIKYLKNRLSQDFIDFKTRDIVQRETKAIRELLLVKAFANNDEFDERDLFSL